MGLFLSFSASFFWLILIVFTTLKCVVYRIHCFNSITWPGHITHVTTNNTNDILLITLTNYIAGNYKRNHITFLLCEPQNTKIW